MAEPPWRIGRSGLSVTVRLTPRGGRDALEGIETLADGKAVLKARVRAAPTEGEANAALVALLARALGLPRSKLAVTAGATARVKTLEAEGDGAALAGKLAALFA